MSIFFALSKHKHSYNHVDGIEGAALSVACVPRCGFPFHGGNQDIHTKLRKSKKGSKSDGLKRKDLNEIDSLESQEYKGLHQCGCVSCVACLPISLVRSACSSSSSYWLASLPSSRPRAVLVHMLRSEQGPTGTDGDRRDTSLSLYEFPFCLAYFRPLDLYQ